MDITELDLSEFLEKEETSELSKKLVEESKAFMASCGKESLEVYRIEKFVPTPQPKETYGKFYSGDSYVVLKKGEKEYDIHYWHGVEATTDEVGSSAAFTVQLSGVLPMGSNHHLEEQMHEGDMFMSYFKKTGVEYLPGGVESGFKDVTKKEFTPRLLQVKGSRYPRVIPVDISVDSLNEGDVFILDQNEKIFFWPGDDCNKNEKMKALEVVTNIRKSERNCHAEIYFPKDDAKADTDFWSYFGGKPSKIRPAVSDDAEDPANDLKFSCYKISNDTGKLLCTEITERPLKRTHLDTNDTFILELPKQIYIWIGREANVEEKKNALIIGKSFLKAHNKPKGTRVTRIVENAEDSLFKSFFDGFYPIIDRPHGGSLGFDTSVTANQNMAKVANQKREAVKALLTKLGTQYTIHVYLCRDGQNIEIPAEEYGHFFQDEVYLIDIKGDHRYLIQWFGPRLAGDLVSKYREHCDILTGGVLMPREITRISVQQGHEDDTLLTFFQNGFICHDGPYQGLTARLGEIATAGTMYRVQGPFGEQPQAIQQDLLLAKNLNSSEAFLVISPGGAAAYAWLGEGSSAEEAAYCEKVASKLAPGAALQVLKEGSEPQAFWDALGGKTEYASARLLAFAPDFSPRLFCVSSVQGYVHMKEVPNYAQDDLNNNEVMVLDAYRTIYVWVGNNSNKFERKGAHTKVEQYLEGLTDGRVAKDIQIVEIHPCSEPFLFTCNFPEWEQEVADQWLHPDPFTAERLRLEAEKQAWLDQKYGTKTKIDSDYLDPSTNKFELSVLKNGIPEGVNPRQKEAYLEANVFESTFGMNFAAFDALKDWKKKDLKKAKGLF